MVQNYSTRFVDCISKLHRTVFKFYVRSLQVPKVRNHVVTYHSLGLQIEW